MSATRGVDDGRQAAAVVEVGRGALDGFEARLRPATALRWPPGERLGPSEAVELAPALTDLLVLHRGPPQHAQLATHDNLMIELGVVLAHCRPGLVPVRRLVYRSGGDRLTYQATRATGTLALIVASHDRFVLSATLHLIAPDLDLDGVGPFLLAGTLHLPRG